MSTPRFEQIKQHIVRHIEQGDWLQHAAIPSENELAQQFGVSRMTARRAITELVEHDVLVRHQGKGTFVADQQAQTPMLAIHNIADEIRQRGHRWHCEVLALESVAASLSQSIAFGIDQGAPLYYSSIVHFENNLPVQFEQRWVNAALISRYLQQDFNQLTPHEYLCQVAPLTAADHIVEAVGADSQQAPILQVNESCPCLQIQRLTRSRQGVISQATLLYPGHRYRLGAHLDFDG